MSIEATLTLNWWGDQNFKRLRERGAAVEIVSLPWSRLTEGLSIYPFLDRREAEFADICSSVKPAPALARADVSRTSTSGRDLRRRPEGHELAIDLLSRWATTASSRCAGRAPFGTISTTLRRGIVERASPRPSSVVKSPQSEENFPRDPFVPCAGMVGTSNEGDPVMIRSGIVLAVVAMTAPAAEGADTGQGPGVISSGAGSVIVGGAPAARQGDTVDDGSALGEGSANVFINGKPVVTTGDRSTCGGIAIGGNTGVFINGKPVARAGDLTTGCPK